jgi:predicted DNA-binding protein with PD1-like motif
MLMLAGGQEMEAHTSKALEVLSLEGNLTRLEILLGKLYKNL